MRLLPPPALVHGAEPGLSMPRNTAGVTREEDKSMNKDKQLRAWIQKQKQLINEAQSDQERDYIAMMWLGYLNGLRLTNAITKPEYDSLYEEIRQHIDAAAA